MSLTAYATDVVEKEKRRRSDLRVAVCEAVNFDPEIDEFVSVAALRRHLALYYGKALADGATFADLGGAVAVTGGIVTDGGFLAIELVKPSRAARTRIAAKWNRDLPRGEIPQIRRLRHGGDGDETGRSDALPDGFVDIVSLPEGSLYQGAGGVFRQVPPQSAALVTRDGGVWNKRGQTIRRKRRFPAYLQKVRDFLDTGHVSAVDRQILEHVVEGHTLRWIADELGMKKPTVFARIRRIRRKYGIAGPGAGR